MRCSIALQVLLLLCIALVCSAEREVRGDEDATFDNAKLKTMLEGMGYQFSEQNYDTGLPYFRLTVPYQDIDYKVDLTIKRDGSLLWIIINLKTAPMGEKIPKDILIGMLQENYLNSDRIFYAFNQADGHFRLKGSLPTSSLQPIDLRRAVDEAVHRCNHTYKLWNPDEWPAHGDVSGNPVAETDK